MRGLLGRDAGRTHHGSGRAGTLSFLLSVVLWFVTEDIDTAIYVGLWVPSLFSLGSLVLANEGDL